MGPVPLVISFLPLLEIGGAWASSSGRVSGPA